jgi:peptide deformylase
MDPYQLYRELGESLQKEGGLGLAAPQIGYPYRVFVIRSSPIIPFFNPLIVDVSDEAVEMEEGSLTFPGVILKITRPRVIRVRYTDPNGKTETKKFQDMTARVILHELDHLNGVLFGQHVGEMQLDIAIRKAKKAGYTYLKSDLK